MSKIITRLIREKVKDILLVNDDEIRHAMKLIYERMKLVIEPSAAVSLAAVLRYGSLFRGKRVGIILCGGNVDLKVLSGI